MDILYFQIMLNTLFLRIEEMSPILARRFSHLILYLIGLINIIFNGFISCLFFLCYDKGIKVLS